MGGRSASGDDLGRRDGAFPFFNVAHGSSGTIFAVGWTGQWAAEFLRDGETRLNVWAGMEHIHLKLLPGEEIRSPRILAFQWQGEREDSHNQFRRFVLRHHTPLRDGEPVECPIGANTWFLHNYGNGVTEENQIETIRQLASCDAGIECFWLDAGWYEGIGDWGRDVGNWFPKKRAFPNGLKPVADEARRHAMGFILWFEPERVQPGTWLYENHPEWLIMPDERTAAKRMIWGATAAEALLNLGNTEARQWLTDHISTMIDEVGIDFYRQDLNMDTLGYWLGADAPDRVGITEIRHIEGLYAFWDELLRRHPGLAIDNCSTGARRIDLETISRSVVLWRCDYTGEPEGVQAHGVGLSQYIPSAGAGCFTAEPYTFRSHLSGALALCWGIQGLDPAALDPDDLRRRVSEFKMLRPLFHGDFHALTEHSTASDVWCAYQLHREDLNLGALLAFRRARSPYPTAELKLKNLEPDAGYEVTDVDSGTRRQLSGRELMEKGLEIAIPDAPGSVIMIFRRA